jgi:Flp pilus assembly protein TadG
LIQIGRSEMNVPKRRDKRKNERGSVLAVSALGMLSVLLATGLAIDISRFYSAQTELQNAADAAALAGVSGLDSRAAGITEATNRAVQAMNKYDFNKTAASFPGANVMFAVNLDGPYMSAGAAQASPHDIRFVKVTTSASPIGVSFAASVLGNSKNLSATATAGYSVPINVFCNWIPLSVIDYDTPMAPGQTYTIRSSPGNSVSPGNYQILAAAGPGGKDVRLGLASGVDLCAEAGATYDVDTKPGQTSGPVRQGINTRFDDYQGGQVDPVTMPPDTNVKENITYAQYRDGSATQAPSHTGVPGRRVVIIPIVRAAEYDQGRNTVTFNRFGQFFLQSSVGNGNGGDIQAEYISDIVVAGKGGYDPNGGAANNLLAVPVLYK